MQPYHHRGWAVALYTLLAPHWASCKSFPKFLINHTMHLPLCVSNNRFIKHWNLKSELTRENWNLQPLHWTKRSFHAFAWVHCIKNWLLYYYYKKTSLTYNVHTCIAKWTVGAVVSTEKHNISVLKGWHHTNEKKSGQKKQCSLHGHTVHVRPIYNTLEIVLCSCLVFTWGGSFWSRWQLTPCLPTDVA